MYYKYYIIPLGIKGPLAPEVSASGIFIFKYKMKKVIFFIDGFNLYHAIANQKYQQYKWLNLNQLANHFINRFEKIESIYYFTALTYWNQDKVKRHNLYIKAQETVGVKTVYGEFKKKTKRCRICSQVYETYEEKGYSEFEFKIHTSISWSVQKVENMASG